MWRYFYTYLGKEDGQDLAEYGLIGLFITVAAVAAATALGSAIADLLSRAAPSI